MLTSRKEVLWGKRQRGVEVQVECITHPSNAQAEFAAYPYSTPSIRTFRPSWTQDKEEKTGQVQVPFD